MHFQSGSQSIFIVMLVLVQFSYGQKVTMTIEATGGYPPGRQATEKLTVRCSLNDRASSKEVSVYVQNPNTPNYRIVTTAKGLKNNADLQLILEFAKGSQVGQKKGNYKLDYDGDVATITNKNPTCDVVNLRYYCVFHKPKSGGEVIRVNGKIVEEVINSTLVTEKAPHCTESTTVKQTQPPTVSTDVDQSQGPVTPGQAETTVSIQTVIVNINAAINSSGGTRDDLRKLIAALGIITDSQLQELDIEKLQKTLKDLQDKSNGNLTHDQIVNVIKESVKKEKDDEDKDNMVYIISGIVSGVIILLGCLIACCCKPSCCFTSTPVAEHPTPVAEQPAAGAPVQDIQEIQLKPLGHVMVLTPDFKSYYKQPSMNVAPGFLLVPSTDLTGFRLLPETDVPPGKRVVPQRDPPGYIIVPDPGGTGNLMAPKGYTPSVVSERCGSLGSDDSAGTDVDQASSVVSSVDTASNFDNESTISSTRSSKSSDSSKSDESDTSRSDKSDISKSVKSDTSKSVKSDASKDSKSVSEKK